MKKVVGFIIIGIMVLQLFGCKSSAENSLDTTEDKIEEIEDPYEFKEVAEEIVDISESRYYETDLNNLPKYFDVVGFIDEDTIVGLTKNKLFVYYISEERSEILSDTLYWNGNLSEDKKTVLWNNENWIGVYNLETNEEEILVGTDEIRKMCTLYDPMLNKYFLSPDSELLVLNIESEMGNENYIYDSENNSHYKLNECDNMVPISWDENGIIFTKGYLHSKDKESYSTDHSFRNDIFLFDVADNALFQVSYTEDGEWYYKIPSEKNQWFYKGRPDEEKYLYMLNFDNKLEQMREEKISGEVLYITKNDEYIVLDRHMNIDSGLYDRTELVCYMEDEVYILNEWNTHVEYYKAISYDGKILFKFEDVDTGYKAVIYEKE